jgi:hypothetical protein
MRLAIILLLLSMVSVASEGLGQEKSPRTATRQPAARVPVVEDSEAYAVYSAFIAKEYERFGLLVIERAAGCCPERDDAAIKERMPSVRQDTLDDFFSKKGERQLAANFELKAKYVIVGGEDLQDVFPEEAPSKSYDDMAKRWDSFYAKYPGSAGVVFFSTVGFNLAKDQALLFTGRACGPLCGLGQYVLLEKKERVWGVKDFMHLWAS